MSTPSLSLAIRTSLLLALGASWAEAQTVRRVPEQFPNIQAAIGASVSGDIVDVGPGIYIGWFDFAGKDVVVRSRAGARSTVLDAANQATVVTAASGETSAAVLEGFTLRRGSAERGGGLRIEGASPTIRACAIHANRAFEGGGIYLRNSTSTIEGCFLYDNLALYRTASGGIGGAIYSEASSPTLRHLSVSQNFAASGLGLGLYVAAGSALVENSIFHNAASIQMSLSSNTTLNHCVLDGIWIGLGTGNIAADPRFVDPGIDHHHPDLHLRHDSPCIDAGAATASTGELDTDPRANGAPDIGADEYFRSSHWYGGNPISGGSLRFRGNGAPGDLVVWLLAGNTLPFPIATEFGDLVLDLSLLAFPMGIAPGSGVVSFEASLPWLLPTTFHSQVLVGSSTFALSKGRQVFVGGI